MVGVSNHAFRYNSYSSLRAANRSDLPVSSDKLDGWNSEEIGFGEIQPPEENPHLRYVEDSILMSGTPRLRESGGQENRRKNRYGDDIFE